MNWSEILNQMQAQGSIFWLAAVSVALGATLLLVSGMVLARRQVRRPTWRWRRGSRKEMAARPINQVQATETGYEALPLGPRNAVQSAPNLSPDQMADLMVRLRTAANSLEDLRSTLKTQDQILTFSGLKADGRDVEYVFKAGIG